jgi:hypothetical protein
MIASEKQKRHPEATPDAVVLAGRGVIGVTIRQDGRRCHGS